MSKELEQLDAVMKVSSFRSHSDHEPEVIDLQEVSRRMSKCGGEIERLTLESRKARREGDEAKAKMLKAACGMYVPSAVFSGGHGKEHIVALTGGIVGDIDDVPTEQMPEFMELLHHDEHTLLSHITNSEEGARIIAHWIMIDDDGEVVPMKRFVWNPNYPHDEYLQKVELIHSIAYAKAKQHYFNVTGMSFDKQTVNINRGAYYCHDSECYYNGDAQPFVLTLYEVREAWQTLLRQREEARMSALQLQYQRHDSNPCTSVFDLVESWVSKDIAYVPGSYNHYVMKCMYLLNEFQVPYDQVRQWAVLRFADYPQRELLSIVRSCMNSHPRTLRTFNQ